MKLAIAVALLLFSAPLLAADDPRIAEGTVLHDAGKYDEAIAKYKAVLADDPQNTMAIYEMAFAYQAKGDLATCRVLLEPIAGKRDSLQPLILGILGNCLDMAGESRRAIDVYRKGLKINPNDTQLIFNLAVALAGQKKYAEARELLKKELALRQGHAGAHYLLGQLFEEENFRVAAILEFLRLLAIESGTPRVADAAKRLVALLSLGVERKDERNIDITIDPKSRTEEGDFKIFEMGLAIASAGRFTDENQKLSDFEKTRSQLATSLQILIEAPPEGGNHTVRQNVPFFARLGEKKLIDVFAGIAILSLGLDGGEEWMKRNEAAIREYATFAQGLPR